MMKCDTCQTTYDWPYKAGEMCNCGGKVLWPYTPKSPDAESGRDLMEPMPRAILNWIPMEQKVLNGEVEPIGFVRDGRKIHILSGVVRMWAMRRLAGHSMYPRHVKIVNMEDSKDTILVDLLS